MKGKGLLQIDYTVPQSAMNLITGLAGTYNKDPTDDFTKPDGTTIPTTSTETDIYKKFGNLCKFQWKY